MKEKFEIKFENILENLVQQFDSNPYSLSQSQLQMLKWFSQNPGYLGKPRTENTDDLVKTGLFTAFIKKNLKND